MTFLDILNSFPTFIVLVVLTLSIILFVRPQRYIKRKSR